ncbi:MAG: isoprenylcysteine carboxylmethyltransferase family protein, partial [Anaerolineae bacterium]|nr:isoprenylcysteine carboxylmethyltransferase family protein [Anaerolineae bacterium]
LYLLGIAANAMLMHEHRETVAERSRAKGMRNWDKVVGGLWGLCYFIAIPLIAGLDTRLGWTTEFAIAWHAVGIGLFVAGFALTSWSMRENAYFSTVVRVQEERGHTVCTSGPYRFVRHPGYVGAILQSLGVPLVLGSPRALIPGAAAAALMTLRTALEDRTLRRELTGYEGYTKITRCRLIPRVW